MLLSGEVAVGEFHEQAFDVHYNVASAASHVADTAFSLSIADDPGNVADLFVPMRTPERKNDLVTPVKATHELFLHLLLNHVEHFHEKPTGFADYRALEDRISTILAE